MPDKGTRLTDKAQAEIERRMRKIYQDAQKELTEKLDRHTKRMNALDKIKRQQLESGQITPAQYKSWLRGQMFTGQQWKNQVKSLSETLLHANEQANAIVEGKRRVVFGENAIFQSERLKNDLHMELSFDVYDSASVTRLLRDRPELLPRRKVDKKKDRGWNQENIADAVTQGIIQGDSIPEIAKRIASKTSSKNEKAMVRYARTAMTGAQNAGRMEALHEAQEMGIKVKKVWLATLDSRTRHAHGMLDGQVKDVDEPFESEFGPIMYPGDLSADPANTWNCRCTLIYKYEQYPMQNATRYDQESGKVIDNTTYKEWQKSEHPDWDKKNVARQATKPAQKRVELEEPQGKSELVTNILPRAGIDTLPCARWDHTPTEDEIINLIAGADQTNGSCASVALAYVGNKAGYVVRDFRDRRSRDFFSTKANTKMLAQLPEVGGIIMNGKREISIANKLLATMEEGKQYWFGIGRHASIVRTKDGHYEYLELQSKYGNGWKRMYEDTLKWRFGCVKQRSFAMDARLMDVDKLAASDDFKAVLKYINTEEGKQRKGDGGGIK